MKTQVSFLLVGLLGSACLIADCGGDDTGEATTGSGGSAGKGGSGTAGKSGGAGSTAGSLAGVGGMSGSIGVGGSVGGSSGSAGSGGKAGAGGTAGSAGAPVEAGSDAKPDSPADAAGDAPKESAADAGADVVDAATAADANDGAVSSDASDASVGALVINEVFSEGTDYVEFYNKGGSPIDISGWFITDDADSYDAASNHLYIFPAGTIVASHAFLLLTQAADAGGLTMQVALGSGDRVTLHDNQGTTIDQAIWGAGHAHTYSRCPDGTGAFSPGASLTPGVANVCADQ